MPEKTDRPKVPKFKTEAEEAKWWDDHMDMVEDELIKARRDGTARRDTAMRVTREAGDSRNITIRIPVDDIERARRLAQKKGLGYQAYMKMLLLEALDKAEAEAGGRKKQRRA